MMTGNCFLDVGFYQHSKHGQHAFGDVFITSKTPGDNHTVCVLADGLGSGIKANVLATLTATMAMKFVAADIDMQKSSEIIMSTLPVCSERKIGYSTFTIMNIGNTGDVKIMEYDNPSYLVLGNGKERLVPKNRVSLQTKNMGVRDLWFSDFLVEEGDRIVVFTDGVTQSVIGTRKCPLGWTDNEARAYVKQIVSENTDISARNLAKFIVSRALQNDSQNAGDDISCAVVHFRTPRKLMILTGPPINKKRDPLMAGMIRDYPGKKVICGGTTASIVGRELGRHIDVDLSDFDPAIPPVSIMRGVDLVTEGTLTLSRTAELLEKDGYPEQASNNAANRLLELLLDCDVIEFVVGTKINEAHQDPNLPAELDIRRNLIKRIVGLLKEKFLKEASIQYI